MDTPSQRDALMSSSPLNFAEPLSRREVAWRVRPMTTASSELFRRWRAISARSSATSGPPASSVMRNILVRNPSRVKPLRSEIRYSVVDRMKGARDVSADLEKLSQAERLLAEVASVQDALDVVDYAEAARVFAQRAKLGTSAVNHATVVKVLASMKVAEFVNEGQERGVIATRETARQVSNQVRSADMTRAAATLDELGVDRRRLAEYRVLHAGLTEREVREAASERDAANRAISSKELLKVARQRTTDERVKSGAVARLDVVDGIVGTIVADPPWRYGNTSTRGAAEDHYPTMSIDELCRTDDTERDPAAVARKHAGEQAHLYLWATAGHLPEAFAVMDAWGFTYKTYLVWVKPQMGMGNYFRVSTELVLFGVKGDLRTNTRDTMNYFTAKRGKHSKKPLDFYDIVTKSSPGPYLEMFSRCRADEMLDGLCECSKCRLGWQTWGHEA